MLDVAAAMAAFNKVSAAEQADAIRESPAVFRDNLRIDLGEGRIVPLGIVAEPWQRADFKALDPGWQSMVNGGGDATFYRGWLERPRGHSKTTDIAAMGSWAIYASQRKLDGVVAAGSEQQAGFLRNAADSLVRLNPWLGAVIEVQKKIIVNKATGSTLTVLASDESTSYGHTPDFVILDEVTHWKKRGLWNSLYSSAAKRPRCMLVVISNAGQGMGVSWQWEVREMARTEKDWYFHRLEGPKASWITQAELARQKKGLPLKEYNRLWLNLWQSSSGDVLDIDLVEKSVVLAGPLLRQNCPFALGALDLGLNHDHAAFVVLGLDPRRRKIMLQHAERWMPSEFPNNKISLKHVEDSVVRTCKRLEVENVAYDPWQCVRSAEELEQVHHITTHPMEFVPSNLTEMAKTILQVVNTGMLELFEERELITDLARLTIHARGKGFKLEAPRDERGHCDLATALVIGLPFAVETMNGLLREVA